MGLRRLPTIQEIMKRAEEKAMQRQVIGMGVEPITPTKAELKESGVFQEARVELMRGETTEWDVQQHKYISDMAEEMGLKLITRKEYVQLQRIMQQPRNHKYVKNGKKPKRLKRAFAGTIRAQRTRKVPRRTVKKTVPSISFRKPIPLLSVVPKIKTPFSLTVTPQRKPRKKPKRRKSHTTRTGKTMRKLNGIKGVSVFSFPDKVWKTRPPRKQKRRRRKRR